MTSIRLAITSFACLIYCVACAPELEGQGTEGIKSVESSLIDTNGLSGNGLSGNGLSGNGLSGNGLSGNGLSGNGLSGNGLSGNGLFNAWFVSPLYASQAEVMKYVVRCALPAGAAVNYRDVNGVSYSWAGGLGLAPGWATKAPTVTDQRWVTACLMAHVNADGLHGILVSLRGAKTGLATTSSEKLKYNYREAAFWGNVFAQIPEMRVCDARFTLDTVTDILQRGRGCGADECGFTDLGTCSSQCALQAGDTWFKSCNGRAEIVTSFLPDYCGDGWCSASESAATCATDCH